MLDLLADLLLIAGAGLAVYGIGVAWLHARAWWKEKP